MIQSTKIGISAAEYYQLPEYEHYDLIQLINGEVIVDMPPTPRHQRVVREIFFLLILISKNNGGEALSAPIEVYLDEHNIFEPDVLYLVPDTTCKVEGKRLVGAPDLIVEVLSPSTAKYDRQEKYRAYEQHGVGEYWIVDPAHEVLEVWILANGHFDRMGTYAGEDTFTSKILGETISVKTIFNI